MDKNTWKRQLARLLKEKMAFQAQSRLLENFVDMARAAGKRGLLNATMSKTLELTVSMTRAQEGSLFLLDEKGHVVACLLTAEPVETSASRHRLISRVMDQGLAGWVHFHRKPGLVRDTRRDPRWLPLRGRPYEVRSALAVPVMRERRLFGILTLMHSRPHHFDIEIRDLIQMTADQMALVLENVQLYNELEKSCRSLAAARDAVELYSAALDNELEKGRQIQQDFLPLDMPTIPGWEIAAWFEPARRVAGDFYDLFRLPGGALGLVVGDVCDKGVGAALYMALFRSLLPVFSERAGVAGWSDRRENLRSSPDGRITNRMAALARRVLSAVYRTNRYLCRNHSRTGMFATLFFGGVDPATGHCTYVNAGHEPAYVLGRGGMVKILGPTAPCVGMMPDSRFAARAVRLGPAETLVTLTDGVTEARSPSGEFYGRERLRSLLAQGWATAADLSGRIKMDLTEFLGGIAPDDDITLLALRRLPSPHRASPTG